MKLRARILLVLTGACGSLHAQDPQFSQFYAAQQYLDPALTGNAARHRLALNHRVQWPGVRPGFITSAFAYDHRFAGTMNGAGLYVVHDEAGTTGLYSTTLATAYAHAIKIDRAQVVRFGLRAGYTMRGLDPSGLLFGDQIVRDGAPRTIENGLVERVTYPDLAAGVVYHSARSWAGLSMDHLNRPDQSLFLDQHAPLAIRTSVHGGHRFPVDGQHPDNAETTMTLTVQYKAQAKWDQLDVGGYIEHKRVSAGIWYRGLPIKPYRPGLGNNEALVLLMGLTTGGGIRIAYSYDVTISRLTMQSGGAHELSVGYEWPQKVKDRKHRIVPCPKF